MTYHPNDKHYEYNLESGTSGIASNKDRVIKSDIKHYEYDLDLGTNCIHRGNKIISCLFDKYIVKIILSPSNEFLGIQEISINKSFLTYKQKMDSIRFFDIEKLYDEDLETIDDEE